MQRLCNFPGASCLPFCGTKVPTAYESMMDLMNIITRVVLGILAAKTSPALFIPCMALGVFWGVSHTMAHGNVHSHHAIHPSGCGQGFMESVAGMHFPMELTVLANLGITICHLDHHPEVFVPYCAVAVGMWTGQLIAKPLTQSVRWLQAHAS